MTSTRSAALVIDTVVCLTLAKWETVSGRFGGYLKRRERLRSDALPFHCALSAMISPTAPRPDVKAIAARVCEDVPQGLAAPSRICESSAQRNHIRFIRLNNFLDWL